METNRDWDREAERPTDDSAESRGDEREQTGTHQGKPVAGLDDSDDPGTTGADKPKPA
jgi:hypothetical protein